MAYNVKFLKGTSAQFNAEGFVKDLNTFYYIDNTDLYLGGIKLSNDSDLAAAIVRIAAIEADYLKNTDKTALQGQIDLINQELGALTGTDSGKSISQMIKDAVDTLDRDLQGQIDTISGDVTAIKNDYLKAVDKTELEGKITAEATTARAAEKANADAIAAVKEDVDAFFKDADLTEAAKDTLKEIQTYIESDVQAAAAMTESINGVKARVKAIEDDYLVEADKTELQGKIDTKASTETVNGINGRLQTVEGKIDKKAETSVVEGISEKVTALEGKVDVEKVSTAISTAVSNAVNGLDADITSTEVEEGKGIRVNVKEVDGKITNVVVSGNYDNKYDVKGAAAGALTDAKAFTTQEIGKLSYDAAGSAEQALKDAKAYADGLATNYDAAGSATSAYNNAKNYADSLAGNYATKAQGSKADTAVQSVVSGSTNGTISVDGTDVAVKGLGSAAYTASSAYDAAGSANTAETNAKTYAKNYADGLAGNYDAKGAANTAESNAKAYVDGALTWGTIA